MKTFSYLLLALSVGVSILLGACASDTTETAERVLEEAKAIDTRPQQVLKMESTHGIDAFQKAAGVSYSLNLIFGGTPRFKGTITQTTNMDRISLKQEGEHMVFDGKDVHVFTTGELNTKSARFKALTWPYFFSLPFKLADPGTVLEPMNDQAIDAVVYRRAKLTFTKGTGDAPDDWYILYFDEQNRLAAAAYIVTFGGKSQEEAIANAHAIRYLDYQTQDGVQFSRKWTFHDWSEKNGWTDQIGEADVFDIELLEELSASEFEIPDGAIATGAPQ